MAFHQYIEFKNNPTPYQKYSLSRCKTHRHSRSHRNTVREIGLVALPAERERTKTH